MLFRNISLSVFAWAFKCVVWCLFAARLCIWFCCIYIARVVKLMMFSSFASVLFVHMRLLKLQCGELSWLLTMTLTLTLILTILKKVLYIILYVLFKKIYIYVLYN